MDSPTRRIGVPVTYADEPSRRVNGTPSGSPSPNGSAHLAEEPLEEPGTAEPSPVVVPPTTAKQAGLPLSSDPLDDGRPYRGFASAAETSGLPITEIVYWFALALAAGADVAAFHQVVSLILRDQGDALVWLMVVGLTAIALTLAHFAGRLARDVTAGRGPATWKQVFACAIPWVALGLAAFAVRLIVADSSGGTTVDGSVVGGADIGKSARQASAAVLFLVLYVGAGAVAAFGEFLSRNPLRSEYRRALRAHHRALTRLSRSQPPYELAVQVYRHRARSRAREDANWQAAKEQRLAHADELKRYAAVLIAAHLQDPSVTEAMTLPDRRPIAGPNGATAANEPRPAIEARQSGDARPAIEARPAAGADGPPQLSATETDATATETVPRHGSPALVATIPSDADASHERDLPADRTRADRRSAD
jgi:hypothetical protein